MNNGHHLLMSHAQIAITQKVEPNPCLYPINS